MVQQDMTERTGGSRPRYRGRHLPMVAVVIAAFIATALAYSGMVLFGLEVAGMSPVEAYAMAGFLEVSLVAVALMARNAALDGRPYGVLLTLTWILSGTSGVFAALHEVAVPSASTPYMVVFRFVPPLVAALMWHLALVGERHLVTGHTLDERRRESRVHQYVTALEMWRDARLDSTGSLRSTRTIRAAHRRQRAARDRALKLLTVEDFERRMQVWVERLEAAERHGNRLDTIGADSVKRGMTRGTGEEAMGQTAVREGSFAEVFEAALATEPSTGPTTEPQPERPADATPSSAVTAEPVADAAPVVEASVTEAPVDAPSEPARLLEPLPETGHTRRVEVFGLVQRAETAAAGAEDQPAVTTTGPALAEGEDASEGDDDPTAERDRRIVELARAGRAQKEIAAEVSASRSTVSRVLRRSSVELSG